jgi:hypothetical protein
MRASFAAENVHQGIGQQYLPNTLRRRDFGVDENMDRRIDRRYGFEAFF